MFLQISIGNSSNAISGLNNELQSDGLNDNELLEIFDKCEFVSLMNLADSSYRFRKLIAQHIIIPKYLLHQKIVEINVREMNVGQSAYDIKVDGDYSITIHSSELALKALRNFGYLISRIRIYAHEFSQTTSSNINEYCSESLQELTIADDYNGKISLDWKKPFQNVSKVYIVGGKWNSENSTTNLNEIFPSMRHLRVSSIGSSKCITLGQVGPTFIPLKFNQLEEIEYDSGFEPITKEWIEFVGKQEKLKILIINALLTLERFQQLKLLIEKIPELEVIKINLSWIHDYNEIAPIMVAESKLKKVIFYFIARKTCNELIKITDSQWQFEGKVDASGTDYIDGDATFIHRKNNF